MGSKTDTKEYEYIIIINGYRKASPKVSSFHLTDDDGAAYSQTRSINCKEPAVDSANQG